MLFKKACDDPCGFCQLTGFTICAHQGGCWNQRDHVPDDFDPKLEMAAAVFGVQLAITWKIHESGLPTPDKLN